MSVAEKMSPAEGGQTGPYRVLVVDDSAVIRTMLSHWLDSDPEITVVGVASDGLTAVDAARRLAPEVVLLDIEMPRRSGLEALPEILKAAPDARVVMVSTLTKAGAEISMQALAAGASDYIAKPQTGVGDVAEGFRRDIFAKVKALGGARREASRLATARMKAPRPGGGTAVATVVPGGIADPAISLRKPTGVVPKILAIGSSTGGPQALMSVLAEWKQPPTVPVVITQHMPAAFTAIMAQRLDGTIAARCKEAEDGDALEAGVIYLAKGGYHMVLEARDRRTVIRLDDGEPEHFCKPSVNPMFRSAAKIYGPATLAAVLTGMGNDGIEGAKDITEARGMVVAQDQASSVVWGMPGAVASAGLCTKVVPLDGMAATLQNLLIGDVS